MEENKKSTEKQRKFMKKYSKFLKKGPTTVPTRIKDAKISKRGRGIVYLGNIPHGFYEDEMKNYFSQFGTVTQLRLCRSKKTGRSKGYAFIEFLVAEVAKIVAETMDNYLMEKRLLKAKYIPSEEQHLHYFVRKPYTSTDYPRKTNREANKKQINSVVSKEKEIKYIKRLASKIQRTQEQLAEYGILYDFKPVDVPEEFELNENNKTNSEISDNSSSDSEEDICYMGSDEKKAYKNVKGFTGTTKLYGNSKKLKKDNLHTPATKQLKKLKPIKNVLQRRKRRS